jgi:hypothetical protein
VSSDRALVAIVAAYVAVVLWCLAFGDSLRALADILARSGLRLPRGRGKPGLGLTDHLCAACVAARARFRSLWLPVALAAAAFAVLTGVAVVAARDVGSGGKVGPEATLKPKPTVHAWLSLPRLVPPVVASHSRTRAPVRLTPRSAKPAARAQRTPEVQATHVSYVSKAASAPAMPAASTSPNQGSLASGGPGPLPAPRGSSAPRPLKAP